MDFIGSFSTLGGLAALTVVITGFINKTFKVEKDWVKQLISWLVPVVVSVVGVMGLLVLLHNLKKNLPNGEMAKVTRISNRNSEAIGYIATYIVPFVASDFSSLFECGIFVVVMGLIYAIYTNSNMILINPLLSIWYSLLEIEYKLIGDSTGTTHDALIITDTTDYKENVDYQMYQIGFKLYYGKERR